MAPDPLDALPRIPAERVMSILAAHGATPGASGVIARIGEDLRVRTLRHGREVAATVSLRTGKPVLPRVITGEATYADISDHLNALVAGHPYVALHTHPSNSSVSAADAFTLVGMPELRAMAVLGVDGTWYIVSKPAAMAGNLDLAGEVAAALVVAGSRTDPHAAWSNILARWQFRYDRLEPELLP